MQITKSNQKETPTTALLKQTQPSIDHNTNNTVTQPSNQSVKFKVKINLNVDNQSKTN